MEQVFSAAEVRTRSVPAAGHLVCMGYEPLRVISTTSGPKIICFSPAAREAYDAFFRAKAHVDQIVEAAQ